MLFVSAFLTPGCHWGDDDIFGCVRGNGDVETEEFFLPEFSGIKLEGSGHVFIRQGATQEVLVQTDRNLIHYVDRDVHNGLWTIRFERCVNRVSELTVFITVPDVDRLIVSGSGTIKGEDPFSGFSLETNVNGSGHIEFEYTGQQAEATISGSGTIDLTGSVEFLDVNISGSGDLHAFDLLAQECEIHISGSGDARVHVEDFLKVRISGSGDVLYTGFPQLDVVISGSGSVIDRN